MAECYSFSILRPILDFITAIKALIKLKGNNALLPGTFINKSIANYHSLGIASF